MNWFKKNQNKLYRTGVSPLRKGEDLIPIDSLGKIKKRHNSRDILVVGNKNLLYNKYELFLLKLKEKYDNLILKLKIKIVTILGVESTLVSKKRKVEDTDFDYGLKHLVEENESEATGQFVNNKQKSKDEFWAK